jgi:hypothetical protein
VLGSLQYEDTVLIESLKLLDPDKVPSCLSTVLWGERRELYPLVCREVRTYEGC